MAALRDRRGPPALSRLAAALSWAWVGVLLALSGAGGRPAAADDVAATTAPPLAIPCASCPPSLAPVCAGLPGAPQLRVTVQSACVATCQGFRDVVDGPCQGAAAASAGAVGADDAFEAKIPDLRGVCDASAADAHAAEGYVLLGCGPPAASDDATAAAAAAAAAGKLNAPRPFRQRLGDLLTSTDEQFLLLRHLVERHPVTGSTRHYVLPTQTSLRQMAAAPAAFAAATPGHDGRPPTSAAAAVDVGAGDASAAAAAAVAGSDGGHLHRKLLQVPDNRRQISAPQNAYPNRAIGQLTLSIDGGWAACSGAFFSPDDVLTAAHCVVDPASGATFADWTFFPAKSGSSAPYGSFSWSRVSYMSGWVGAPYAGGVGRSAGSTYLDNAVVTTTRPSTFGWVGASSSCGTRAPSLTSCGYPGDKGGLTQYCSTGVPMSPIDFCDANPDILTSSSVFIAPGMSGGPVLDAVNGTLLGIVSGGISTDERGLEEAFIAPLDAFNWKSLVASDRSTWGTTRSFRATKGPIISGLNGKCLDTNRSPAAGRRPRMVDCSSTSAYQIHWKREGLALRWMANGNALCLDLANNGNANGNAVQLASCKGAPASQRWFYDRWTRLRPFDYPTKCLEVSGSNTKNGALVQLWDCNGGPNQSWRQQ